MTNVQDAFLSYLHQAHDNLEVIQDFLEDHMEKDPERMDWTHVGDAQHIAHMLQQIVAAFNLEHRLVEVENADA